MGYRLVLFAFRKNLTSFDAIVGIPNKGEDPSYAADLTLVESYVAQGET